MIGKIIQGKHFAGLVKYVLGKEGAYILDSDGILLKSMPHMIRSFEVQSSMRSSLGNKVGHISLSFSPQDKERMTDKFMTTLAHEYLKAMGITNTQYLIVRHTDREHPHCHIVFNHVNNSGQTIKDSFCVSKSIKICRDMSQAYKLYMPQGKEFVNIDRLREPVRTKYEIWQIIKDVLNDIRSWDELKSYLHERNIEMNFKYKRDTQEIQGISFTKGKYSFKGSNIDRSFSYAKLNRQIQINNSPDQKETRKQALQKSSSQKIGNRNTIASNIENYLNSIGVTNSQCNKLLKWEDEDCGEDEEIEELLRNHKGRIKFN